MSALDDLLKTGAYDAVNAEKSMFRFWDSSDIAQSFTNDSWHGADVNRIAFMIPPPNVTGKLHLGHALDLSIIDALCRFFSMIGKHVLCIPGLDHAGIATQKKVLDDLVDKGKDPSAMSILELTDAAYAWKNRNEKIIIDQVHVLGIACNWAHYTFSLDDDYKHAVSVAFKKLYDAGRIYRGKYLVNWDTGLRSAIADEEVEYLEISGHLWFVKYKLENSDDFVVVATTRIETIFVDVALAVHPDDERFTSLWGLFVINPLTNKRLCIITDRRVQRDFGSGVLKITPAHDKTDYEIAQDANLLIEYDSCISESGTLNHLGLFCDGDDVLTARQKVGRFLADKGFLDRVEDYTQRVGISSRSKARVEILPSEQWFIAMAGLQSDLLSYVENKHCLYPDSWKDTFMHWVSNLKDWCISRQLWWGHRIPVWHSKKTKEMVCSATGYLPEELLNEADDWMQDTSVLDTWFSSGIWPIGILGWPVREEMLERFYPFYAVVTGYDILFFWVVRMIILCVFLVGQIPFRKICLHGLLYGRSFWREKDGRFESYIVGAEREHLLYADVLPKGVGSKWEKLSKSKGNVVDPVMLSYKYGADVLRYVLLSLPVLGSQIDVDERRYKDGSRLLNKIWNAFKCVLKLLKTSLEYQITFEISLQDVKTVLDDLDYGILGAIDSVLGDSIIHMESFELDRALKQAVELFWDKFCAEYLEFVKLHFRCFPDNVAINVSKIRVLLKVFLDMVKLLHPYIPYITEKIYQECRAMPISEIVPSNQDDLLFYAFRSEDGISLLLDDVYCKSSKLVRCGIINNKKDTYPISSVITSIVNNIRSMKSVAGVGWQQDVNIYFIHNCEIRLSKIAMYDYIITGLGGIASINYVSDLPKNLLGCVNMVDDICVFLVIPRENVHKALSVLHNRKDKLLQQKCRFIDMLSNNDFVTNAPKEVIKDKQDKLNAICLDLDALEIEERMFFNNTISCS